MGHSSRDPGSSDPRVSVVVPAYNEAPRLYENLEVLYDHLTEGPYSFELVIVDDGSGDDTATEALRFAVSHDDVRVVSHRFNFGLGQAMKTGFRAATGAILVTFDADLSYSPDHIDRLVETLETTGASVVVASPYLAGGTVTGVPRMRALMSKWANRILQRLSLHHISTVTGMVRAYDSAFINGLSLKSMDNQINAEIIYKATLLRRTIIEIPANLVWTRDEEETKTRRGSMRFVTMIIDSLFSGFIFRPFTFFIVPGVILLLMALYALGWAAWHVISFLPEHSGSFVWIITEATGDAFGLSPHSFVIGGIALIVAFQLISIGIISAQNKRYFEELWYQGTWMAQKQGELSAEQNQAKDVTL